MVNTIDFNKDIARDYGLRESVIATYLWELLDRDLESIERNGRVWTRISQRMITVALPFMSVDMARRSLKKLAEEGIDAEIINIHTIKPIDKGAVVASARKTGAVLTVENHNVIGGLQSAVLEALAMEKIPVVAVGVQDHFGEVGKLPYLREVTGLTVENIVASAKKAVTLK